MEDLSDPRAPHSAVLAAWQTLGFGFVLPHPGSNYRDTAADVATAGIDLPQLTPRVATCANSADSQFAANAGIAKPNGHGGNPAQVDEAIDLGVVHANRIRHLGSAQVQTPAHGDADHR